MQERMLRTTEDVENWIEEQRLLYDMFFDPDTTPGCCHLPCIALWSYGDFDGGPYITYTFIGWQRLDTWERFLGKEQS